VFRNSKLSGSIAFVAAVDVMYGGITEQQSHAQPMLEGKKFGTR
jgi:hypothetical protein